MTQIELVKAFLRDGTIQEKYGLTPGEVEQMTLQTQPNAQAKILVDLIKRMVDDVESQLTDGTVARNMNQVLENSLR